MEKYVCYVCGYPNLDEPPRGLDGNIPSFDICDCCGIEFGYEDTTKENILKYRQKWIGTGGEWFCKELCPENWDMKEQLKNIGVFI
jgi:hypothetical protein